MLSTFRQHSADFLKRHLLSLSFILLSGSFLIVLLADRIFVSIPAGHGGVLWERFGGGTNVDETYSEGFHTVWPWNIMNIYNLRLMETTETIPILANNGLRIDVEILIRFRLDRETLGELHKHMGRDYLKVLVIPEVNAQARNIMSAFDPEEIYSDRRAEIQELLQQGTVRELFVDFGDGDPQQIGLVYVDDVLIKMVNLPASVRAAIEAKEEQKHLLEQYEFILQREAKESQRKEIEAQGISRFQEIIQPGISDKYLRWKGIDATLALSKSNNSKIVIIGAGEEGLPLILGNMSDPPNSNGAQADTERSNLNLLSGEITPLATPNVPLPPAETSNPPVNSLDASSNLETSIPAVGTPATIPTQQATPPTQ